MSARDPVTRATLIGLVAIVLWSSVVGLIRSISEHFGPVVGAALIFTVAGVLVSVVLGIPKWRKIPPAYMYGCGSLFIAYEICLSLSIGFAQNRQQALELGMINYLWPSLTVTLAVATRQQRAAPWVWPGLALAFVGIGWVMKGDGPWDPAHFVVNVTNNPLAYSLALVAAFLWAIYSVLTRRVGQGANAVSAFLLGSGVVLWTKFAISGAPLPGFSLSGSVQVLCLGAAMATAYSCWNHGVQRGNMTVLAVASFFTPVFSSLLAALWLRTQPGVSFWQGVAMVVTGSIVCWHASRARRAQG